MARKILGYYKPGDAEYVAPDEDWAKSQTVDQLISEGYALTPEQRKELSPSQRSMYQNYALGIGVNPDDESSWQGKNPVYHNAPQSGMYNYGGSLYNPNVIMSGNENGLSFKNIIGPSAAMILGGMGISALTGGLGAGAAGANVANIPGLSGAAGIAEAGAFPLTTLAPSAIEAGMFPLTTVGGGLGAGVAAGAGAGSSLLTWENAKKAYDLAKQGRTLWSAIGGSSGASGSSGALGSTTTPQQPSQNQWARIFDLAALVPHSDRVAQPSFIQDDMIQNKTSSSPTEMWQGLPQGMRDGGAVDNDPVMVPGPENRMYARHAKRGFRIEGEGTGQSDEIPTMLADGEYVFDSDCVAALGDGSNKAGADVLDKMREEIRKHKRATSHKKIPPPAKSPMEYIAQATKK